MENKNKKIIIIDNEDNEDNEDNDLDKLEEEFNNIG
jgi:hypothetical protein